MSSSSAAPPAPTPQSTKRPSSQPTEKNFAPNYKLENLPKLSSHKDYEVWKNNSEYILDVFNCWDIVRGAEKEPVVEYNEDGDLTNRLQIEGYKDRYQYASTFFLQTVDPAWLPILRTNRTPPRIWIALQNKFARENTTSFYNQLSGLLNLKLESKAGIADHLIKFDTTWNDLQHRCSTAEAEDRFKLPFAFKSVFESLEAKAALMLYTLPSSLENVVDNLQTKQDLTYDQAYQKLIDLTTDNKDEDDKAYRITETKGKEKANTSGTKECSYCKKHYPKSKYIGHLWNECNKLKADREKRKEKKEKEKEDTANVATEDRTSNIEAVGARSTSFSTPSHSPSTRWVIDTAASSHMTNNIDLFINIEHHNGRVRLGDDHFIDVSGKSTVELQGKLPTGKPHLIVLRNVLYVPKLGQCNLLSWRAIGSLGNFFLESSGQDIFIRKEKRDGHIVVWGKLEGLDYVVQQMEDHARLSTYEDWHKAFGHVSPPYINPSRYTDGHLIPPKPQHFECDTCTASKSTKRIPPSAALSAKRSYELIHSDLSGKFSTPSLGKSLYYITLIDDYSRYAWIYFLKLKSDATPVIKNFVRKQQRQHPEQPILRFRTDNGGEYVNKELEQFFTTEGITHELTPPYSHESNGVAERFNRTIITMARGMLSGLPLNLWSEATNTAVYLKNRMPHKAVKDQTPYEVIHGTQPTIQHLQPFGRKCYVHIPEERRPSGSKLLPRAIEGKFIGYTSTPRIFRIYVPSKHQVVETRQVRFTRTDSGEAEPHSPPSEIQTVSITPPSFPLRQPTPAAPQQLEE